MGDSLETLDACEALELKLSPGKLDCVFGDR